ncbi:MAG: iron ABC transporter permease [Pseudomonadota bacterium]
MTVSKPWLIPVLLALIFASAILSVAIGSVSLAVDAMVSALSGEGDPVIRTILLELRLPRAILALSIGAILGLAGAALQGYLRNPLAEPAVLGTSNGAALGAVIAFYFGFAEAWPVALPIMAIGGAALSLALLFLLAGNSESPLTLILAGIAIATLAGAGISLALNLSPNPFAAMEITIWLLGSLEDRSFQHVAIALPCIAIGAVLLASDGRALDALTLGEDGAAALGADLRRTRTRLLLGVAIGVGGAVAVAGAIGFVGLIVPHLIRPLTDRAPSSLLLPSALAGAALLTLSDVAVRIIPATTELRLGVVTAFLGVPFFLIHLMRERRLW